MNKAYPPRSEKRASIDEAPALTIAGAGISGLAAAWYATRAGLSCRVLESDNRAGGNALTITGPEGFRYDSGAHRYHDRNQEVTADLKQLMGDLLLRVEAPSQIFFAGRFIDFPLSPFPSQSRHVFGIYLMPARHPRPSILPAYL